jgi:hypothetical protein
VPPPSAPTAAHAPINPSHTDAMAAANATGMPGSASPSRPETAQPFVPPPFHSHSSPLWQPPVARPPWMAQPQAANGAPQRLQLVDTPQQVGDRRVHMVMALNDTADLVGGQGKVRVTFLTGRGGIRVIHLKGLSCFVAHLGGRPSPAVQIDQPGDISLVTPRAQEIGHIRVANGTADAGHLVFPIGSERAAVATDDCTDPILFDFGPESEAYLVYTRGRPIPKTRRR